ncbi:MAG: phosphatidylserine decarboxylase [Gammaproteobacteria bacterium]|nr:phosphatidylserine decarboxylase [Gammaproteobacteria bacterium]
MASMNESDVIQKEPLINKEKIFLWLFYIAPHHFISRIVFTITRMQGPFVKPLISWFIRKFNVDMSEAQYGENLELYETFNEFFTRSLKEGVRPVVNGINTLACPADGTVSQSGKIEQGLIFQAKGHLYTTTQLLGGDETMAKMFENGKFATIYLAPHNYHRLHMPTDARLYKMIHVPGRLFSVAPWTVEAIPRIFARNERVVCLFNTRAGPLAMVLVGAINVAAIETVWSGLITPPMGKRVSESDFSHTTKHYKKGDEMGRFNMGSTIILLMGQKVEWLQKLRPGNAVKVGELIGHFPMPQKKAVATPKVNT